MTFLRERLEADASPLRLNQGEQLTGACGEVRRADGSRPQARGLRPTEGPRREGRWGPRVQGRTPRGPLPPALPGPLHTTFHGRRRCRCDLGPGGHGTLGAQWAGCVPAWQVCGRTHACLASCALPPGAGAHPLSFTIRRKCPDPHFQI